jgi:hypothetical protein
MQPRGNAIGWSELGVTRDHVTNRGESRRVLDSLRFISLYKQSSFLVGWAARSTQYSTLHLLVTLSNTLRVLLVYCLLRNPYLAT